MPELLAVAPPPDVVMEQRPSPNRASNILVVVDQACTAPDVCAAIRAHAGARVFDAYVVAPAHETGDADWYVDEDAARAEAQHRLRNCVTCLADGDTHVEGALGDPDPVRAIADALEVFDADEILLVTAPQRPSSRLRPNVVDRARRAFAKPIYHAAMPQIGEER